MSKILVPNKLYAKKMKMFAATKRQTIKPCLPNDGNKGLHKLYTPQVLNLRATCQVAELSIHSKYAPSGQVS